MTSKAFVRKTRPKFYALVQKKITRENTSLTGSSSHEELNREELNCPGTFWRRKCNPYRGMTLHLLYLDELRLFGLLCLTVVCDHTHIICISLLIG